jgi:hypothetical protein
MNWGSEKATQLRQEYEALMTACFSTVIYLDLSQKLERMEGA